MSATNRRKLTALMRLRKEAGYANRDDFADRLGVNRYTYKSWETGAAQMSASQLVMVADALDCSIDEMLGRDVRTTYLSPREAELNDIWHGLSRDGQDRVLIQAKVEQTLGERDR